MGNIRLFGATSGFTELAPPAVAPDGVLSLPSGTGTIATEGFVASDFLPIAGGKILQVVRATDTTNRTTSSTSLVDVTGMAVTITPQKSTSAIIIIATGYSEADNLFLNTAITDSSNNIISSGETIASGSDTSVNHYAALVRIAYATPATTLPVTFKLRFSAPSGQTARMNNAIATGQILAIEVSA